MGRRGYLLILSENTLLYFAAGAFVSHLNMQGSYILSVEELLGR